VAVVFWAMISPVSEVPSEVGYCRSPTPEVWMTLATARIAAVGLQGVEHLAGHLGLDGVAALELVVVDMVLRNA
jgi:hypothetical protein